MSEILKKEDGTEVEVFSPEEIEAQKQEAIEAYKAENPDKSDELAEAQEKARVAEEALEKAKGKDLNFDNLRKAKEVAEKKVEDILAGVDDKINTVKKEVLEGVMKDHYNDTIKALAGEDVELLKKIEFNYKRLGDVVSTKQEMDKKLQDAWALSTKQETDGVNMSVFSSGGVSRLNIKSQDKKFTADEEVVASKFGISKEDIKKYSK